MVNPGFCQSELLRDTQGITGAIMRLFNRILAFTAEEGSRQLVWAAVGGEPEMLQGEYKYLGLRGGGRRFCAEPGGRQGGESALVGFWQCWLEICLWFDCRDELVDILGEVDPRVNGIIEQYITATLA
jgi:hypothetical protein